MRRNQQTKTTTAPHPTFMRPIEIDDNYDLSALLEHLEQQRQQQQQSTEPRQVSEPVDLTEFVNHILKHGQPLSGTYIIYQTRLETASEVQIRLKQEAYCEMFL